MQMDDSTLQLLLLFIGIVIIVAVYFYSKYQSKEKGIIKKDLSHQRIELSGMDTENTDLVTDKSEDITDDEPPFSSDNKENQTEDIQASENIILALNVRAKSNTKWSGEKVLKSALASNLRCGHKGVFEYIIKDENDEEIPLFHVANFVKPGIFEWENMAKMEFKGLSLFIKIPTICPAKDALTKLLDCGQQLTDKLNAQLYDDKHQSLSKQTVKDMYALCKEYDTKG